jgi:hypothetical protein
MTPGKARIRTFAVPPRFSFCASTLLVLCLGLVAALVLPARLAAADNGACTQLAYTFQPDCYHPDGPGTPCRQTLQHLDLGPQIAVWVETADHALVDTLMVTNLTAIRGIGNRPGIWNFRSGPKFPYGKRWMALPLWAYARGKLYNSVAMQDDREDWMGFHEAHSSKELYFCRPLMQSDVNLNVDAVTCPSPNFNSAKGKMMPASPTFPRSYYPPRNDLVTFVNQDCDNIGGSIANCTASSTSYSTLNDLDAVAAATPAYGSPYTRTWRIPANLPEGEYVLAVEVNKEYDTNPKHSHVGFDDVHGGLSAYGIDGNFGQPSVIYRVPIHLGGSTTVTAAASQIAGYSSWPAPDPPPTVPPGPATVPLDGVVRPRDTTISTTVPGSGEQRLLEIDGPTGKGRVHVELRGCGGPPPPPLCDGGPDVDGSADGGACSADGGAPETPPNRCEPLPPAPGLVTDLAVVHTDGTSATIEFRHASDDGKPVEGYEVRYRLGTTMTLSEFMEATPAPLVLPDQPGLAGSLTLSDLKPGLQYVLGFRSIDECDQHSAIAIVPFMTTAMKFKQLSGCFVATAAWGSALEPHVEALRHARDRLRPASPLFSAATDLYYRSGPAAADLVGRSEVAKAMARRVLGPFAGLAEALDGYLARDPDRVPNPQGSLRAAEPRCARANGDCRQIPATLR